MKKTIMMLSGMLVALTSCDDNAWNDKLDGFEEPSISVVKTVEYTLTDKDYATIAGLEANVALAGADLADALAAVKKNGCFSAEIPAEEYLPAFLASSSFPYFALSDSSVVKVTYNEAESMPEDLSQLAHASHVTITTEQYQEAWGSDDDYIKAFAPSVRPARWVPIYLNDEFDDAEDGDYVIVGYNYAEQDPIFSVIEDEPLPDPLKCLIVTDGHAAITVAEDKSYGYLKVTDVDVNNLTDIDIANVFTFTPTKGGYYIQDCYDRYLYQTGTYNSFNFATEPADGSLWTLDKQSDGTTQITNANVGKTVQYDENYGSYGSYADITHPLPVLYPINGSRSMAKAPVVEVPTQRVYALYQCKSNAWSQVNDIAVLQPADYEAMTGNAYLPTKQADEYLPAYLSRNYPYAADGDVKTVAWFSSSSWAVAAREYVYDGAQWHANAYKQLKTSKFVKYNGVWGASSGLDVFTHVKARELVSGYRYMIVTDGYAANCLAESYNYGYLKTTKVASDDEHVNITDATACEFTFTKTDQGWTIQDQYGRYYYLSGTYNSYNVGKTMESTDANGYYWEINVSPESGLATITNTLKHKIVQYDENYGSYGAYEEIGHPLPALYIAVGQ